MIALYIGIGVLIGSITTSIIWECKRVHGVLRIDNTDPDKTRYKFEIDDLDILDKKNRIELEICRRADHSQK